MRRTLLRAVFLLGMGGAAAAQDFGPTGTDIDVRGVIDDELIVADRNGQTFICVLLSDEVSAAMTNCLPIVHIDREVLEAREEEVASLVESLEAMPQMMAGTVLANALREMGCAVRVEDEETALREIAAFVAPQLAIAPELLTSDATMDAIEKLIDEGVDFLADQGRIRMIEATRTVALTDCE